MNEVKNAYPDGVCPDCGRNIPSDACEGWECPNCGHVCYSESLEYLEPEKRTFEEIIEEITDVLEEGDEENLAIIANQILSCKVTPKGDDLFEVRRKK